MSSNYHMDSRFTDRRHGHFFWHSIQDSIYLHVREPDSFSLEKWHLFWTNVPLGPEEREDLKQAMMDAHAAWLNRNTAEYLLSHGSMNLRAVATRSERRRDLYRMTDQQVAQALYEDVADGWLVFVPDHEEMRKCLQAIREERDKAPGSAPARTPQLTNADMAKLLYGKSPRMPQDLNTPLGGVQPFEYTPDALSGNVVDLAGGEGTPGNNQAQNKQFKAVVKAIGLDQRQARQLHEEISGEGLGYHEIMERAQDMFGGSE